MKNKTQTILQIFFIASLFIASLFIPSNKTFAASLTFTPSVPDGQVGINQMFKVRVELNTEDQTINTFQTQIYYPHDLLKLTGIEDGSSFISMWLEPAHEQDGTIDLSGIVPRGFNGNINVLDNSLIGPGEVVTLTFEPIRSGIATIGASTSVALLNDGNGTPAVVKNGTTAITIGNYESDFTFSSTDKTPPDFVYAEAHYDSALGGEYLFFQASDKDSGIDHYEINENGIWQTIESPYLIKQNLGVYYIKAVDRAGNETIKAVQVPVTPNNYLVYIIWLALGLMVILVVLFWRRVSVKQK